MTDPWSCSFRHESRIYERLWPDLTMIETGRLRPNALVTTFPVAGIKYHDQNFQEGRVSSESQSGGAAHVSRKTQRQELEKDGHIVSVSWGAGGGGG